MWTTGRRRPSSWLRRTPIIALGWVGFFFAGLMAAYQLGYVDSLWDPFFGNALTILIPEMTRMRGHHEAGPERPAGLDVQPNGTEEILNSDNQQGDSHEHHRHASGLHE
ncbi:MAG: hypothetical protein M3508_10415 [Actinomycetota bacterium]|nr:hypothetical protein [Actinomycetota bacterium]